MLDGERRCDPPSQTHESHGHDEKRKASPCVALHPREDVVRVLSKTGNEHHDTVRQDEQHEPAERNEVGGAGRLPVQHGPKPVG